MKWANLWWSESNVWSLVEVLYWQSVSSKVCSPLGWFDIKTSAEVLVTTLISITCQRTKFKFGSYSSIGYDSNQNSLMCVVSFIFNKERKSFVSKLKKFWIHFWKENRFYIWIWLVSIIMFIWNVYCHWGCSLFTGKWFTKENLFRYPSVESSKWTKTLALVSVARNKSDIRGYFRCLY